MPFRFIPKPDALRPDILLTLSKKEKTMKITGKAFLAVVFGMVLAAIHPSPDLCGF
jgi:hypothetical protein